MVVEGGVGAVDGVEGGGGVVLAGDQSAQSNIAKDRVMTSSCERIKTLDILFEMKFNRMVPCEYHGLEMSS